MFTILRTLILTIIVFAKMLGQKLFTKYVNV